MKLTNILYIFLLMVAVSLTSCSLETDTVSGDGNIEGFWHLELIETLAADSISEPVVTDCSKLRLFWAIQHKLLVLTDKDGNYKVLNCRFTVGGGQLTITEVYEASTERVDTPTDDLSLLAPYGITRLNPTFSYTLSGSHLTLTDGNTRLYLKRF